MKKEQDLWNLRARHAPQTVPYPTTREHLKAIHDKRTMAIREKAARDKKAREDQVKKEER